MSGLNIMIVGVGGQGTLLASRVLGSTALRKAYDVKVSEVHGMSQRGGSVVTYVKMGERVYSPVIEKGEAGIILAFEELEALRWIEFLKKGGRLIVNSQKIDPMPVITGKAKYPEGIINTLKDSGIDVIALDALELAQKSGSTKAVNIVLLGVMAAFSDLVKEEWLETLRETVPAKLLEVNLKAFEAGYAVGRENSK